MQACVGCAHKAAGQTAGPHVQDGQCGIGAALGVKWEDDETDAAETLGLKGEGAVHVRVGTRRVEQWTKLKLAEVPMR